MFSLRCHDLGQDFSCDGEVHAESETEAIRLMWEHIDQHHHDQSVHFDGDRRATITEHLNSVLRLEEREQK
jgi:hypothetical protein